MQNKTSRRASMDWLMSDETAVNLKQPFFSQSDLLKRGWSKSLIERVLGKPDWTSPNPHISGAAMMLCWCQDRVLVAEGTTPFQEYQLRKSK